MSMYTLQLLSCGSITISGGRRVTTKVYIAVHELVVWSGWWWIVGQIITTIQESSDAKEYLLWLK